MTMDLEGLRREYDAYVDTFRVDGKLPPMMELKREHTAFVVANARAIAAGERMDPTTAAVCEAAALLHDTGRYEQLRRYDTFRDSDSVVLILRLPVSPLYARRYFEKWSYHNSVT